MQAVIFDLDKTVFAGEDTLYDDVAALLAILRRLGMKVGALTSGDHRVLVRLEEVGIRHHFDDIICSSHIDAPKAPEGIEHLLGRMHVEPHHTALVSYVADDMALGKQAGLAQTIRVAHGPVRASHRASGADYVVEDIATVLDVLE